MQSFIQVQLCHPLSAFLLPACSCISFLTIATFISSDRRLYLFLSGSRFTSLGPCYVYDLNRTPHTMGAIGNKCAKHRLHVKPMKEDLIRAILRSLITSKRHFHLLKYDKSPIMRKENRETRWTRSPTNFSRSLGNFETGRVREIRYVAPPGLTSQSEINFQAQYRL